MKRASGILMHITSLPQEEGIGTFGKEAYEFADFLKSADQKYWQVLPLGPVGYGNSPYQAFSAFAGNPYMIDLQSLVEEGLLSENEEIVLNKDGIDSNKVDFDKITAKKLKLLYKAYKNSLSNSEIVKEIEEFKKENQNWLDDYSLFMAIKGEFNEVSWQEWPKPLKCRDEETLKKYREKLKEEIGFWDFTQYEFSKQWYKLKDYVNGLGIKIIGDIPIYVSADSSDTWSQPELFKLDEECQPITVAGCPPDAFTEDGQLWGNPIYDWEFLEATNFKWWVERMKQNAKLYDMIRIDHFRGFESYWEVPFGDKTARNGKWTKGPGIKLFNAINKQLGDVAIIAEDLGFITDEVVELREKTGYPGMKILEFAFDPKGESEYLPHNCDKKSVAYIGTHDNETIVGWMEDPANKKCLAFAKKYLRLTKKEGYAWGFIRGLWATPSELAIAQMQDILGLDSSARMNIPSTVGDNWNWRMQKGAINEEIVTKLKRLTKIYGRKVGKDAKRSSKN